MTPPEADLGGSPGGPKFRLGPHVGASWANLRASWAILNASWTCLGSSWGSCWPTLRLSWHVLVQDRPSRPILDRKYSTMVPDRSQNGPIWTPGGLATWISLEHTEHLTKHWLCTRKCWFGLCLIRLIFDENPSFLGLSGHHCAR